jgi:hypothetical protein
MLNFIRSTPPDIIRDNDNPAGASRGFSRQNGVFEKIQGRVRKMRKIIFIIMVIMISVNMYAEEVNRHNVSDETANPKRIKADDIFYVKLGYGGILGEIEDQGTSFGFGYRHEMDALAVDFGFLNYIIGQETDDSGKTYNGNLIMIQGLYFLTPVTNNSFYAGGGLAYNFMRAREDEKDYSLQGIAGIATVGYEIMRASTVRLFAQFEVTVPFGMMKNGNGDSYYGSAIAMSLGIGF